MMNGYVLNSMKGWTNELLTEVAGRVSRVSVFEFVEFNSQRVLLFVLLSLWLQPLQVFDIFFFFGILALEVQAIYVPDVANYQARPFLPPATIAGPRSNTTRERVMFRRTSNGPCWPKS